MNNYKPYEDPVDGYCVRDINDNFVFNTDTEEKCNMIISALEKQIPKNVIIENGWKYCPACYECINDDYGTETNYCSDCGQRLEW